MAFYLKIVYVPQEKRHQMMNDIKALCNVTEPSLVQFIGAYHAPENGQVGHSAHYSTQFVCWHKVKGSLKRLALCR